MALTKVTGGILSQPIDLGITTATTGFFSGIVTAQSVRVLGDLTVDGSTTTLDTVVTEVDRLEVGANNVTVGVAITQSGTGDILNLYDSSTPVFVVKDGGKVGIGTNNPVEVLHVLQSGTTAAEFRLENSEGYILLRSDNNLATYDAQQHIFRSRDASSEYGKFDSDGNLGIGTNNPAEEFHLYGNTAVVALVESIGANDSRVRIKAPSDRISYLEFADDDADAGEIRYDHTNNYMSFHVNDNVERLRITSDGNIYTANDQVRDNARLTLSKGHVGISTLLYLHNSNGSGTAAKISSSKGLVFGADVEANSGSGESFISFETDNNEKLRITSDGKIGIGTDNPTEILDVRGDLVVAESLEVNRPRIVLSAPNDGTNYRHLFGANLQVNSSGTFTTPTANISGGGWEYLPANSLNDHGSIRYLSAPDTNATTSTPLERLRIASSGNVGIGIYTTPQDLLTLRSTNNDTSIRIIDPSNNNYGAHFSFYNNENELRIGGIENTVKRAAIRINRDADDNAICIDTIARVGIGSTTPTQKLDVDGSLRITGQLFLPSTDQGIKFGPGDSVNDDAHIEWKGNTTNAGYLRFSTSDDSDNANVNEYIEFGDYAGVDKSGSFTQHVRIARDQFLVRTGSNSITPADRFLIDSSGNVGIGTDNPSQLLHLEKDSFHQILLKRTDASPGEVTLRNEGNLAVLSNNVSGIDFQTGSTPSSSMRIDSNGRILIGHSSTPTAALSVAVVGSYGGSSNSTPFVYICRDEAATAISGGESLGQILFASNDGVRGAVIEGVADGAWSGSSSDASLVFKTTPDNATVPTEKLRITSGGNVGIGTDNPLVPLHIWNDSPTIRLQDTNPYATNQSGTISQSGGVLQHISRGDGSTHGSIFFYCQNDSELLNSYRIADNYHQWYISGEEKMRVSGLGYIGIGTANPDQKLHVYNGAGNVTSFVEAIAGDAVLDISNTGNGNFSGINFTRQRSTGSVIGGSIFMPSNISNNEAFLYIQTQSASAQSGVTGALSDNNGVRLKLHGDDGIFSIETGSKERLRIDNTGSVGIGTDGPGTDRLRVINDGTDKVLQRWGGAQGSTAGQRFMELYTPATDDGNDYFRFQTGNAFKFRIDTTDALCLNYNYRVGIGTDNPVTKLHLLAETGDCVLTLEADRGNSNSNENDNPYIVFRQDGSVQNSAIGMNPNSLTAESNSLVLVNGASSGGIRFKTGSSGNFTSGTSTKLFIAPTGEVLINETTLRSYVDGAGYTQTPKLQVEADDNTSSAISLTYNSAGGAANRRASFMFARTADGTAVSDNSVLGEILFMGEGNSTQEKAASIRAEVDNTPGTNDMPGRLIFSTSNDGSDSPTERLRIASDGKIGIGGSSTDAMLEVRASNTLEGLRVIGSNTIDGITLMDGSNSGGSPSFEIISKRSDGNVNTAFSSNIYLGKNRTDQKVTSTIRLGTINFGGNHTDGTEANISYSASIQGIASGDFDSKTDMPTDLVFTTGSAGTDKGGNPSAAQSNVGTERLRITSTGEINIGGSYTQTTNKLNVTGDIYASDDIIAGDEIRNNYPSDFWASDNTFINLNEIGNLTHMGGYETDLTSNGYRDNNGQWVGYNAGGNGGAAQIGLHPSGYIAFRADASKANGTTHNPTERVRIASDGKILIGDDTAEATTGLIANIQTFGTDAGTSSIAIRRGSNDAQAAFLVMSKSRNTSVGSRTILQNGDEVGNIFFVADDGTDLASNTAAIKSQIDGAPGANDTPGNLTFWTTSDNANSATERLRITSSGTVGINCTPLGLPLEVKQLSADGGALRLRDADATYRYLDFDVTGALTQITARSNNSHGTISIGTTDQYGRTNQLYIKGGANASIGIGTDTPSKTLHVNGIIFASGPTNSLDGGIRLESNNTASSQGGVIYGGAHNDTNHAIFFRRGNDGSNDTIDINEYGMFRVFTGGALADQEERLRIDSSGNVGIGTNAIRGPLHIHQKSNDDVQIHLSNNETGSTSSGRGFTIFGGAGTSGRDMGLVNRETTGAIEFYTNIGGTLAQRGSWHTGTDITTFAINTASNGSHSNLVVSNHDTTDYNGTANRNEWPIFTDIHFTGTDNPTGNRSHIGWRHDVENSITTGSNTSGNRIQAYGINSSLNSTKYCYVNYGAYFFVSSTADNAINTQTSIGCYGYAQGYSGDGTNKAQNIYGGHFIGYRGGLTNGGHAYGVLGRAQQTTNGSDKSGDMTGVLGEVEVDEGTVSNGYGFRSIVDIDNNTGAGHTASVLTTGYLYHGSYSVASGTTVVNKRGIWLSGCTDNYLAGDLEISGEITKGSGTFRIPHPLPALKDTKDLVHSFIEGPQMDLIYRGKVDLVNGTATVNLDTKAGMTEGTFVLLNRDVQCFTTNETGWTNVKGSVTGNQLTIIAQENTCIDTISWMVIGERQDDVIKAASMTDNDGNLIVEPDKKPVDEPVKYESENNIYNADPDVNPAYE